MYLRCIYYRRQHPQSIINASIEYWGLASFFMMSSVLETEIYDDIYLPRFTFVNSWAKWTLLFGWVTLLTLQEVTFNLDETMSSKYYFYYYNLEPFFKLGSVDCGVCFDSIHSEVISTATPTIVRKLQIAARRRTWRGSRIMGFFYRYIRRIRAPTMRSPSLLDDNYVDLYLGRDVKKYWHEYTSICPAVTPCNHIFHTQCINGWIRNSLTCPLCRYKLPSPKPYSMIREISGSEKGLPEVNDNVIRV